MQDDLNPQFLHARLERSETNLAIALPLGPVLYNSPVAAVLGLWPGSNDARSASNISPDIAMRYPGYIFQFTAIITPRALCRGWPLRPPCAELFARLKR